MFSASRTGRLQVSHYFELKSVSVDISLRHTVVPRVHHQYHRVIHHDQSTTRDQLREKADELSININNTIVS